MIFIQFQGHSDSSREGKIILNILIWIHISKPQTTSHTPILFIVVSQRDVPAEQSDSLLITQLVYRNHLHEISCFFIWFSALHSKQ